VIIHGYDALDSGVLFALAGDKVAQLRQILHDLIEEARRQGL
jgi:hypothetical protein